MAVVVVTRLRLKDPKLLDDFFTGAVGSLEQAKNSPGNFGADALADANDTWWTVTSWQDRTLMRAFVTTDPHAGTLSRLDEWCDEATFVDWEQADAGLPDWSTAHRHLVADGKVAALTQPTAAHATRAFPPPVVPAS